MSKKIIHLTEEEYRKLIEGKLKLKKKPMLRFKRFKISLAKTKKLTEVKKSGC